MLRYDSHVNWKLLLFTLKKIVSFLFFFEREHLDCIFLDRFRENYCSIVLKCDLCKIKKIIENYVETIFTENVKMFLKKITIQIIWKYNQLEINWCVKSISSSYFWNSKWFLILWIAKHKLNMRKRIF